MDKEKDNPNTDEEMKEKLKVIGRWIAVLPASFAGAYLLYVVFRFINSSFYTHFGFDVVWNIGVECFSNMLMGGAFVYIDAAVAPSRHRVCSCVLFALICILAGAAIFANLIAGFQWLYLVYVLCMVGGAGYSLYSILNDDDFDD